MSRDTPAGEDAPVSEAGPQTRGPGGPALSRALRVVVLGAAAVAFGAWLFLGLAHLGDRFNVNAVSGTFLALADRARDGVLYPPLFDGVSYGGTRSMPVPILLYAGAISAGGDLLASAKLVDLAASAALVVILVGVLLRLGAGATLGLGLAATVVTTQVFLLAGTGIRPESLPTALQLAAVALVAFAHRRSMIVVAAVLCAIAIFCKLTALWAPIAIAVWLFSRNRAWLVLFAIALVVAGGALLAAFAIASDGRILTNLTALGGAGVSITGIIKAPLKTAQLLVQHAQASILLLPMLLLGLVFATRGSRPSIFQAGLVIAAGILVVVQADVGSDYNHLLDVVVLLPIATFQVVRSLAARLGEARIAWSLLAATIVVGAAAGLAVHSASSLAAVLGLPGSAQASSDDPGPLLAELGPARTVLAEDPYIPLSRGERPVVLDAFMLLRIGQRNPDLVEPLLQRVRNEEFDAVVLREDLAAPGADAWFSELAFGRPFHEAFAAHYRLCSVIGDDHVYFAQSLECPTPP